MGNAQDAVRPGGAGGGVAAGFVLVAAGAALWGTDGLFRRGLALELPAPAVVFAEHLVLVAITLPLLLRGLRELRRLRGRDWLAAAVIGAGSSALATVMFTAAFRYGDPTTPLLLQKIQPLVAVAGAHLLLGERMMPRFAWFLVAGVAGAYLVAFQDPTAVTVSSMTPALLAVGAAVLWALGTVLGRHLARRLSFPTLTSLRFSLGLPAVAVFLTVSPGETGLGGIDGRQALAVVLLALVPGLAALLVYYRGLRSAPASSATLAELAFPLTAVVVNYVAFGTVLSPTQWVGTLLLVATITTMGWLARRGERALGVRLAPRPVEEA